MEKMNIIDILRDCPKGTKLYSPLCGECELHMIDNDTITCSFSENLYHICFDIYGHYKIAAYKNSECLLFPSKENRDWTKFQRPFKDGDIIYNPGIKATAIFYKQTNDHTISHCFLNILGELKINHYHCKSLFDWRFASEEEKQELFKVIKDNGYHWNSETKTLEKLPKFKVGDWVEFKYYERKPAKVIRIENNVYYLSSGDTLMFQDEHAWDLTTNKFDINTLVPFESKVLVRDYNSHLWKPAEFGFIKNEEDYHRYYVVGGINFLQCIPYEGNEHLRGTTNECSEYYKNWK